MAIKIVTRHKWDVSTAEARAIQSTLSEQVSTADDFAAKIRYLGGIDVGFENNYKITRAAFVLLSFPELEILEQETASIPTTFPYLPGYLSFREVPAIIEVFKKVKTLPDIILCDGHGIAHPRKFGIASHIGVIADLPTIGIAKKKYVGAYTEPA